MDYFRAYSLSSDAGIVAAWDSVAAAEIPSLRQLIAERGAEIFPEFARRYREVRSLPRSARRALQRSLAHSRDFANVPAEWQRRLAYTVAGAALLLALESAPTQAGTITVGPGCTLINAITSANSDSAVGGCAAGSGADTINLPKGTQTLTAVNNSTYGPTGLPVITSNITIDGNGAKIVRGKSAPQFRLLALGLGGTLTIENSTLSGGSLAASGAAIYSYHGRLYVQNCIITGNRTMTDGGGIYTVGGFVNVASSTISKNSAGGNGGGLEHAFFSGQFNIVDTIVTGNLAGADGGGVFNLGGTALINGSTISKNTAMGKGGGVYDNGSQIEIESSSLITGNKAYLGGGVYAHDATLTIDNSIISKNSSQFGGGVGMIGGTAHVSNNSLITGNKVLGLGHAGGGIATNGAAALYVDDSTISKNSAYEGGGVENGSGTFTLTNSTITGNKATHRGGGVDNTGPAVFNHDGSDTITGNSAPLGPNIYP